MQRAVTAIYRSADVAQLVRTDLEQIGVAGHNITVLSGAADNGLAGSEYSSADRAAMDVASMGTAGGAYAGTASVGAGYASSADYAIDRLHDLGLPEEDARTYQQALRNGDSVVSVEVDDDSDLSRIQEIMRRPEDAYDLDELDTRYADADYTPRQQAAYADTSSMGQMGSTGMTGGMSQTSGTAGAYGFDAQGRELDADGTIKVVEEDLAVGKRAVDRGAVRVRSYVREEPVEAEVDLRATRVFVERRPVNRAVGAGDLAAGERVLEAREVVEEPVVAKEARVVEEIGLRQETEVQHQTVRDTVRRTEVEIEDTRTGQTQRLTGDDPDRV